MSAKTWTKEQEEKLFSQLQNPPKGEKKSDVFRRLAKEFGRTKKSLQMKYYKDLRYKGAVITETINTKTSSSKSIVSKRRFYNGKEKFVWTEEKIAILKQTLLKAIKDSAKQNVGITDVAKILGKKFGYSRSTMFYRLHEIKKITQSKTLIQIYNGVVAGISVDELNKISFPYKSKKNKKNSKVLVVKEVKQEELKKENVEIQNLVSEIVTQEVKKKSSFWQKFNPFYSLKRKIEELESEIKRLKK